MPLFSSNPYQYDSYNYTTPPLKPCLKRPVNMSIADRVYQNRKKTATPSAFQPFSTISEDTIWNPYDQTPSFQVPQTQKWQRKLNNQRPTQFRSEISRFTESLYNLAKPTPIKPRGQFPNVERYPHSSNLSNILNPSLPMKPVQNLDRINPFTGLPNIEFIPTTEYLELGTTSTYLPDGTPSPDTTARRVAALLEPTETYSDLVHSFQKRKSDQHNLQLLEKQMASMSFYPSMTTYSSYTPYLTNTYTYVQTIPTPSYSMSTIHNPNYYPTQTDAYQNPTTYQPLDPTFLGRQHTTTPVHSQQIYNNSNYSQQQIAPSIISSSQVPGYSLTPNPFPLNSITPNQVPMQPFNLNQGLTNSLSSNQIYNTNMSQMPFTQTQLDQAWIQLSTDLQQQNRTFSGNCSTYPPSNSQHNLYQNNYQEPPLQGVLDMMSIDRINNLTKPAVEPTTSIYCSNQNFKLLRNNLSTTPTRSPLQNSKRLENVYDELLKLPKMPKSPSEMEPIPSSEDELTRYNERRRENLLTLMNRRETGNIDLQKYQLSAKYQETKFVENRILGYVPSILGDLNKLDLNKKMNEKNKEISKTLRQVSRSYEDRCKQREKMKSTLSLVKEIPKMEFDVNNKLVAKQEETTKLANVKRSKSANTIKVDDLELEVSDEVMSLIYHKALKEKKPLKQRNKERRRSRTKVPERSFESSSDAEICEFMKNDIFKQKIKDFKPDEKRETKIKVLQRYSPRHSNPMLPVEESENFQGDFEMKTKDTGTNKLNEKQELNRKFKCPSLQIKEFKYLSSDEPVPSPAPEVETKPRKPKNSNKLTELSLIDFHTKMDADLKSFSKKAIPNLQKHGREDSFRKTKSSGAFERIKMDNARCRIEEQCRTLSDPTSAFEEETTTNISENKNLNISKTAKKHLGMAVTPIEMNDNRNEIQNFVNHVRASSDDTPVHNGNKISTNDLSKVEKPKMKKSGNIDKDDDKILQTDAGAENEKLGSIKVSNFNYNNIFILT